LSVPAELVEDPVLRMRYRLTRDGDVLRNELWADPGAQTPVHFHPAIEERFEIREGRFSFTAGKDERTAGPGDRIVVPAGVRHAFENTGDGVGHFVCEIEPAMNMKEFFEESAALGRAGKYTRAGMPARGGMLDMVDFADRYLETTVVAFPPPAWQRALYPAMARLAKRRRSRQSPA
jgi:quercetin dioxygenase-like cupin family protein